ncbi:MAG: xanthine dehydrogenase family protein [Anaerolineales bacterium]|nr:xanthine dehydrogenase family protein [Anaerolineales bacterium]
MFSSLIGARVKRKEDPRLITGAGRYVGDLTLPGMQHVAFLRSPYAHARILNIDSHAAAALPGVLAVVTGEDLRSAYNRLSSDVAGEGALGDAEGESLTLSHYPLSVGHVRYAGEAVAAVVAVTPALAQDALDLISVEWEPLPVAANVAAALAPGAPAVFDELPGNVAAVWRKRRGKPDEAFAAAHRVVSLRLVNQRLAGVPLEPRGTLAAPDPLTGGLCMWTSTQSAHGVRAALAELLRLPENAVRVIAPEVGGGFGVKGGLYPEDAVVAALALRYARPLRWVEQRGEHMLATTHGRGQTAEVQAAVQADGTVTALRLRAWQDLGAYPYGAFLGSLTGLMAIGTYAIPSVDIEIKSVLTNTTPIAAYRGAGRPEAAYIIERLMDTIAAELGLDPVDLRRRNFIAPEAFPYKAPTGLTYDSGAYDAALTKLLAMADYAGLRAEQARRRANPAAPWLGIGLACYVEMCAFGHEGTQVRVEPSGTVTVSTGISPHGQGQHTTFAQMVADELGVPFEHVLVVHGDTALTPMGQGTSGSRGLVMGGSALVKAAAQVRAKALRIAAHILEAAVEDMEYSAGRYQVKGAPGRRLSFKQIAERAYSSDLPKDLDNGLEATSFFRIENPTCPFGAHLAVVEVDPDTGQVRLLKYFTVDDCGPRVSPPLVEGQVHGGLAQGIGQALLEEMAYDDAGQAVTGSLMEYALPRAATFPTFVLDQTVTPSPTNPLGVKGIGEAATIGATPTIVNAVVDALRPAGVRHLDMPLRPERVWRAMHPK